MPEITHYLTFALLMAVGQYTPGPDMLLIAKNTLNHGRRAGFWTVAGICLGVTVHTIGALLGVQVLFKTFPGAYAVLRLAGAAYLAYLGVRLLLSLRRTPDDRESEAVDPPHGRTSFVQGLATNLLNVKVLVLFSSLIAAFSTEEAPGSSSLIYGSIIVGQGILLWVLFVLLLGGQRSRNFFLRWERGMNAVFGVLLVFVAGAVSWAVLME